MCFDYETADISESSIVKCRKRHRCDGCRRWIQRGERAECVSGLFDGAWFRYYVCNGCQRTIMAIAAKELNEGCPWHTAWIAPQELREYQSELRHYGEEVRPLGMPTLEDCRRYLDCLFVTLGMRWWNEERLILLEEF